MQITRQIPIARTARVLQLEGMFDLPPRTLQTVTCSVCLPLDERAWQIGLIVGPSGCGKTTIARTLFAAALVAGFDWPHEGSLLDGFPPAMGIKEITGLLCSVGFSSPPAWLRPFRVLSNGEQFRVTLARALADARELVVIDEFTSVVDRTVAQIGSAAIARTVRQRRQKFIALSCHTDIAAWLQPDWIYEPAAGRFAWRRLQQRPRIELDLFRVRARAWKLFQPHHYLAGNLNPRAQCFVACVDGRPAAFSAALPFPHPRRPGWREHRTVCLPDFQGVGLGNRVSGFVAALYKRDDAPYFSATSHPAFLKSRLRSPDWKLIRAPSRARGRSRTSLATFDRSSSSRRLTASFEYIGPERREQARAFGVG